MNTSPKTDGAYRRQRSLDRHRDTITRLEYVNEGAAKRFLRQLDKVNTKCGGAFPCEHGHLECSSFTNGPCMDEVLSNFPELADDDEEPTVQKGVL